MPTTGYGPKIDAILDKIGPLTEREFAELAIACADQAGLSAKLQRDLETALVEQVTDNEVAREARP